MTILAHSHTPSTVTPNPAEQRDGITVMIGRCLPGLSPHPTDVWETTDMAPQYHYEALYDPTQITLADAETAVRIALAADGKHVSRFLNEDTPRTMAFTDKVTGQKRPFVCLPGCDMDHRADTNTPTYAEDVYCNIPGGAGSLPLIGSLCDEGLREFTVLGWSINVDPYSTRLGRRMPHVNIEYIDEHYIEDLDPDSLETVIHVLQERVDSLRTAHTQLVALRAAYRNQSAVTA
ncbi:DUF6907 domain-containing protein [Streptomyces acidiscabies]|uniref:Uncharacterized protein n=1 Tax=Streptomyces acidiscabies TaxID=42234 RepID=A0AAP6BM19_9ACTN|nr:hypothetical protein [Streptomyces acidiscabies]MBZ3918170.1 hypothetical protein [Streptomyces acidiscabies]MDX2967269.1 hypothetical protein [Streptomyces acidiscabies]MDX3016763.1 hypothetical protein [Streptomyces acidiscabies]MDX3794066.1 hypothetical protein [Streptomyces acidiscabies]